MSESLEQKGQKSRESYEQSLALKNLLKNQQASLKKQEASHINYYQNEKDQSFVEKTHKGKEKVVQEAKSFAKKATKKLFGDKK